MELKYKMTSNIGILLKYSLIPTLLNIPFASCFFLINFDFLLPRISRCDNIIVLPLLVYETTGLKLLVFFCTLTNQMISFYIQSISIFFIFLTFYHSDAFF